MERKLAVAGVRLAQAFDRFPSLGPQVLRNVFDAKEPVSAGLDLKPHEPSGGCKLLLDILRHQPALFGLEILFLKLPEAINVKLVASESDTGCLFILAPLVGIYAREII